jgi:hypothetical protein
VAVYVACPHCKSTLRLKENFARKQARCPRCKQIIDVASSSSETVNVHIDDVTQPLKERARALGIEVGAQTSAAELSQLVDEAEARRRPTPSDLTEEFG